MPTRDEEIKKAIEDELKQCWYGQEPSVADNIVGALKSAGYAIVPVEHDSKMWLAGRSMFAIEAMAFRDATTNDAAQRRLDTGPTVIYRAMLAAASEGKG